MLRAPLLRLALVVLALVLALRLLVAGDTRKRGADRASHPVADTRRVVVNLALGLLVLALLVLVATRSFNGL